MENTSKEQVSFDQLIERGCGVDVHRDTVVATVMGKGLLTETHSFGTTTNCLKELGSWLVGLGVTHGAMESTGICRKPVMHILCEYPIHLIVVNARHIKNVPGRKTDKADSQWICKLLLSGLLSASIIPPEDIRNIRDLNRYRTKPVQAIAWETNRIIRVLEASNIKLSPVVSDVSGVAAGKLIRGLIAGRVDLAELILECCHDRIKSTPEQIREAITGGLTASNIFLLKAIRDHIDYLEKQISSIDQQMDRYLIPFEPELKLLQTIPGVGRTSSIGIICETGVDMTVYPGEHHLASHNGMCPGNNESAGKKRGRTRHGNKHLKSTLMESAQAATRKRDSFYKARYQSMVARTW